MPPSDGPMTVSTRSIPSERTTSYPARAMSCTERSGKVSRYGRPVAGSFEAGPVDPKQLPSELTHTTKRSSVSIASPGPTIPCHQPSPGSSGEEAAWAEGESPVKSSSALARAAPPHREGVGQFRVTPGVRLALLGLWHRCGHSRYSVDFGSGVISTLAGIATTSNGGLSQETARL